MTEPAGFLNETSLSEECQMAVFEAMDVADGLDTTAAMAYAQAVLNVLRKRGLIDLQGLELIKSEETSK